MPSVRKEFEVLNSNGLHARPAALFVKTAGRFSCSILVEKDEQQVSGKSIMGLLTLACYPGCTLAVIADGDDAEEAVEALGELFAAKFHEGE
jgi:phosphocarrier protein HPr